MAEITAAAVKDLREKTGVGMMDCKKALAETNGDMDAAVDWLRTRGLAKAAKKAGRIAAEGLVGVAVEGTQAAIVEVNSETDFVARNEQFQSIVGNIAKLAIETNAESNIVAVHQLDEIVELFPGMVRADTKVSVDVDDWKAGPRDRSRGDFQHRLGTKVAQQQIATVSAIQRRG